MKIVTIIGARPQFIKASTVSRAIRNRTDINEIMVHTGQHFDKEMSAIFFSELDIPEPDYNLGIGDLPHGAMTGRQLENIEKVLVEEKPDLLLVYGDTNSTLAGVLAASKLHIKVAHVEAGLRSFNRKMPEEINRVLTDHISDLLFAPTEKAVTNLRQEGIHGSDVILSGDVMYDAALYYSRKAEAQSVILEQNNLNDKGYILATVHRAENTDCQKRLERIIKALIEVNRTIFPVVLPLHPRTKHALEKGRLLNSVQKNLILTPPVGFQFYMPDPQLKKWNKLDKKLKKQGVAKKDRPAKPARNMNYPKVTEIALALLEQFQLNFPDVKIDCILADALYGTKAFLDGASRIFNGVQVISQIRKDQNIIFKNKSMSVEAYFAAHPGVEQRIQIRGGKVETVMVSSARLKVCAHGKKRFVIALKYEGEKDYRYIVANDMSWRTLDIVKAYTLRWLIEVFFEDFKVSEAGTD